MNERMRGITRRRFLQGLSGSLTTLGLAACEYQPAPSEPPFVATETVEPVTTPQSKVRAIVPTEIEFFIGSFARREAGVFDELLAVYHHQNPHIRIILDVTEEGVSHRARFIARFAAGLPPDIAHLAGPPHYHGTQLFTRLDHFAKVDDSFAIEAYYARIVDYYSYPYGYGEGYLWCLPWNYATESLFYNKQHFVQAEIALPDESWTWQDLRHAALALTIGDNDDEEPKRWGVEFQLNNLDYVLRSFGGGFLIDGEREEAEIGTGSVGALQYVANLILNDRVHPYPTLGWKEGFGQGKVSMALLPEWAAVSLKAVGGLDFDVAPVPQGLERRVTSFHSTGIGMGYGGNWLDASWEVMKWFAHSDGGEWAVARALLFSAGSPVALHSANEFLWNSYFQEPANRSVFLQNLEYAMVPFSDEKWWPYLYESSQSYSHREAVQPLKGIWEGSAAVDEVAKELYERWKSVEWYWP